MVWEQKGLRESLLVIGKYISQELGEDVDVVVNKPLDCAIVGPVSSVELVMAAVKLVEEIVSEREEPSEEACKRLAESLGAVALRKLHLDGAKERGH